MITDTLLGVVVGILEGVLSVLPDMPQKPEAFYKGWSLLSGVGWLLPVEQFLAFLPVLIGFLGAFLIWRVVRLLLPGG